MKMKRITYLILVLPLVLFSCQSTPKAFFHIDKAEVEVGQEVFFTNDSENGARFEWDFGDGYISNDANPSHIFTGTGTYEVVLTVFSKKGLSDKASMTIDALIPTLLEVEVLEYNQEYPVADASIILYPTITDWDSQTNSVSEGFTDADGIAVFSNLEPFVYYLDIWEATHDNFTLRSEDVAFISTPEILPHKINWFIAYVDYVDHGKGELKRNRSYVIKKIVRKASVKTYSVTIPTTDNWQELYNKSIKVK